ncbi:hypothetical protein OEZ85_002274 [Tetradesmus obliquus]|uniref:Uncharacterized protein n=1 Tax=Tetradesmus obliquus TaxID=3088 RepID=A0ABY8U7J9_TETOB|nr:hypothetical protein OEZ85_002274 [Tetradesmus obliquus]
MLTDPGFASASFDDVCEVLGDVAKLDSVSAALNPSALGAGQAALKTLTFSLFGSNAAVSWGLEKVTQNLHNLLGFSLLEGLIDKSLIDLFQQMYGVLDLSGDIGSIPALRLGVAAAVALVFKRANKLKRKFRSSANEALQGRLSPALLLALIEAGVLVHNYSELSNGVSALLGLAS